MKVLPLYMPFQGCGHQCVYCNQPLIVGSEDEQDCWDERLQSLHQTDDEYEIAFYGGTFSALPRETMQSCLERARPYLDSNHASGVRISTRPDRVDSDTLIFLWERGVRTIELGVESFDDRVLQKSGRGHNAQTARDACRRVKEHGFQLGVHLMTGLPAQSEASWRETVGEAIELRPHLARIAPTLVIKNTPLHRLYERGAYQPQTLDDALAQCAFGYVQLRRAGTVIARIGLGVSDASGDGTDKIVAGPWSHALRHDVESLLAGETIERAMRLYGATQIIIHPKDYSIVAGTKKCNLLRWARQWGDAVEILRGPQVERHTFQINGRSQPLFWSNDD
ncbi:MAG: radical SAM protein [Candidatus Hinthialibacter antarcticus]|nr:radical SAM protein [Candidatus Hinthialibacter antarcticus]